MREIGRWVEDKKVEGGGAVGRGKQGRGSRIGKSREIGQWVEDLCWDDCITSLALKCKPEVGKLLSFSGQN